MSFLDLSNYDADHDFTNANWAQAMVGAGVDSVIVGSQWPEKSARQLLDLRLAGCQLWGTYAEPDWEACIALNAEFDLHNIALVVEHGSIQDINVLRLGRSAVVASGNRPYIYGNEGDLSALIGRDNTEFADCGLWLANYGTDDPNNPCELITSVDFCGWTAPAIHQYSSTIVVTGRVRDHNYLLEEDLTPEQVEAIVEKVIADKLYHSQLIDSSQLPELVAQILGVHPDGYTDQTINSAIRAKVFPIAEGAKQAVASKAAAAPKDGN